MLRIAKLTDLFFYEIAIKYLHSNKITAAELKSTIAELLSSD